MSTHVSVVPVVIAGGSGTRLWPLSRTGYPKQFLVLQGTESLFQQAVRRLAGLTAPDLEVQSPLIVVGEEHRFLVLEQLRELQHKAQDPAATLLLESAGRNTAPALTLAALQAVESGTDPVLVVTPADQTVTDGTAFTQTLRGAVRLAADGTIVILGIAPDRPETGYGYIRSAAAGDDGAARVEQFVEKPDLATAQRYLAEGHYHWNSGMFVLKASVWLSALERFRPDMLAAVRAAWSSRQADAQFVRPDKAAFATVPADSIDYSVMERCPGTDFDLRMLPLAAGWNDLGAWDAVWQISAKDADGNAGAGDVLMHDCRNTLVRAAHRLVGTVGLDDVIVIETPDAVLVADRARSQEVKQIVARLQKSERSEATLPRRVHRPWGWYDSVDSGPRFQVKRICVKPGAALSLQMHHHRAEHWIVVSGTAEVICGDKTLLLSENQSTYIPLGQTHRLANPGRLPLELIEVQSGSYLGEDDIVRFEDTYGRVVAAKAAGKP